MYLQTYGTLHHFLDVQVITDSSVRLNLHCLFGGLLRRGESIRRISYTHCCRLGILNGETHKATSFGGFNGKELFRIKL